MLNIAIVTLMRKGSRRFKNKMMTLYNGKELYRHTVEFGAALQKKLNARYYIFHDYDDIYIPDQYGVFQIKRKRRFAGDTHKTCEELLWSEIQADVFILLQCTSPKRDMKNIISNIREFLKGKYLCGLSAHRVKEGFYYGPDARGLNFRQRERTDNGCKKYGVYKETGSFYIFRESQLREKHILDTSIPEFKILFPDPYNIDIDRPGDLRNE